MREKCHGKHVSRNGHSNCYETELQYEIDASIYYFTDDSETPNSVANN